MSELLRFKKKQKYCSFDCETESLNLFYARPWELAFITYEGNKVLERHQHFIWFDDLNVSPDAARITGFDKSKIKREGITPQKAIDIFDKYLYNSEYKIIGTNILGFDVYIYNTLRRLCGKKNDYSYISRCYDTVSLMRAYIGNIKPPEEQKEMILWQYKLLHKIIRGAGLQASCRALDVPYDKDRHHEGLYDVGLSKQVFDKLMWNLEIC